MFRCFVNGEEGVSLVMCEWDWLLLYVIGGCGMWVGGHSI